VEQCWVEQRFSAALKAGSEWALAPEVLCNNCPPAAKAAIKDSAKWRAEPCSTRLAEIALHLQQLGIQQRRSRRAANRVVREHGELPVENAART